MLNLISTTQKLQLVTSAAGAIDVDGSWVDNDPAGFGTVTEFVPGSSSPAQITTATTTDIVAAPGSGVRRTVAELSIRNAHASTSNTVTVQRNVSATLTTKFKCTLLAGEELAYNNGTWFHYDALGSVYSTGGAVVDPRRNDFRLSGVTATPVMTADSTALATIFLAQYKGNHLSLFDGTNWQDCAPAAEISLAVTGRTTDLPFDVFAFLSAGVVTLEFTNWTNATTRATALVRLDGVFVKSGDSTRRYLGSVRARSATTFHWVTVGVDLPVKFDLYNGDNRVDFGFRLIASTNTWAYTIATWRQAQASANYQADVMAGLQEEYLEATLTASSRNSTISIPRQVGIGFDSTTAFTGIVGATANEVASIESHCIARICHQPTIGRHFYSWNEISTATGTCTWVGDDGALRLQSGMTGQWTC